MLHETGFLIISEFWKAAFPQAHVGILVLRGVRNPPFHAGLEQVKQALQADLRIRFAGQDHKSIENLPVLRAYDAHYKRFKKSYPVQAQLESIAFKGKDIPSVSALVEAMFMAEVKNLLLTAGHDLDQVALPVTLGVSDGSETYTLLRGKEQVLKPDDMMMSDRNGVISDVIYGPDQRTQIGPSTQNAMFVVYAPEGIPALAVEEHLQDIYSYAQIVSPQAQVEILHVIS
jgi:DNA/RNA-binding domain of Phe-tRNA-synthetase-like protein